MQTQTLDGAERLEITGDENSMSGLRGCSNERIDHVGLVATPDLCSQTSYSRGNCQGRHEREKAADLSKKVSHDLRRVAERAQRRRICRVYVVPRGNPLPSSPAVARTTLDVMRPSRHGAAALGEASFNASNLSSTASTSSSQIPGRKGLIIAKKCTTRSEELPADG